MGHERCDPRIVTNVLPTRLLYVGKAHDAHVRVVNVDGQLTKCRYLILSYCWGNGNETAKTITSNLAERLRSFETDPLPKTIRDAIAVTRAMGFRYIWIQVICIIQSTGDDDPGDFEQEARKIRDYYGNAECCLSASLAIDSSEGFLQERLFGRFPIQLMILAHAATLPQGLGRGCIKTTGTGRI